MQDKLGIDRFDTTPRSSLAVRYNSFVSFAVTPERPYDAELSAVEQVRQLFAKADSRLAQAGTDRSRLLFALIMVADISDLPAINEEWDAWLDGVDAPARASFQAVLASPALKVEMVLNAAA